MNPAPASNASTEAPHLEASAPRQRLGGLLARKERWALSVKGRFALLAVTLLVSITVMRNIHPFLSVTDKAGSELLIVEGWVPTPSLKQAAAEFQSGRYEHVLVVRGVYDSTNDFESGRYYGDYVAKLLVEHGVPSNLVATVYCSVVRKDRTYHTALAARQWLAHKNIAVKNLDVATLAPHARRSRLLHQEAFGADVHVGIIALDDLSYNADHWWRSSEGVREVIGEGIAYLYARFFFHAPAPAKSERESRHESRPGQETTGASRIDTTLRDPSRPVPIREIRV